MIMDPVLQRLDVNYDKLDKSSNEQLEATGSEQNEETKKVEDIVPVTEAAPHVEVQGEGDDHGVKRSLAVQDEPGPSQKKCKADNANGHVDTDSDILDKAEDDKQNVEATEIKLEPVDAVEDTHDSRGNMEEANDEQLIVPKLERDESQNMSTHDFYSNGLHQMQPLQFQQPQSQQHQQHQQLEQPYQHHPQYNRQPYCVQVPQPLYPKEETGQQYLHHQQPEAPPPSPPPPLLPTQPQQQQQYQEQLHTFPHQQLQHHVDQQHPYPPTPQLEQVPNQYQTASSPPSTEEVKTEVKEEDYELDIKEKLKEMGEISFETVKKGEKKLSEGDTGEAVVPAKKPEEENSSADIRKGNMRRNIREVMDETKLDESTLAAQRQEVERLRRVQEQQRLIRDLQRQANQDRVISLLQGNDFGIDGQEGPSSTKIGSTVVVKLPNGQAKTTTKLAKKPPDLLRLSKSPTPQTCSSLDISPSSIVGHTNLTPSVSIAPVPKRPLDTSAISESDSDEDIHGSCSTHKDSEPVDVIDISSDDDDCIVVSETEDADEDEDPTNSGMHTNDEFNQPDEQGRVVINTGHPDEESDIYLAPQISRIIKPHQIGGIRFLYDNIIESTTRYETSTGFGCILAHSMGLGKTLQVVTFSDIFLRHTSAQTILCIMPINTLQNWLAEYNMWIPTEEGVPNSPFLVHGEVRPRNFNLHVLNDSHKTLAARAKVIHNWYTSGGVLLIGYEQYRLLSLRRFPKSRSKKAQTRVNDDDKNKLLFDEVHEALVTPGPDLVICDEGHRIKNSHASISQALKQMRTKRRVVLTGYPLQNNLMEYWCMVDFVRPNYLGTKTEFCNMFERPIQNGQCIDSTEADIKLMRYRAHVLHSLLLGFVQRRSHRVLQTALPQKEEYVLLLRMSDFQRTLYETFMNEVVRTQTVPNPLKAFAVCCKIWNHPDVLYYYLKKHKGGAVDIDLEEVATVVPTPVVTTPKVTKTRVKKQSKKGKPAASVTPYSSNNSSTESPATVTTTTTSTPPIPNPSNHPTTTTGSSNPGGNNQFNSNPTNAPNNFPAIRANSSNNFPNSNSSMQGNNINYRMPNPSYNAQATQQQQMNYNTSNSMGPGQNYRGTFNQPPTQYASGNQYMNPSGSYQNQSNNYPQTQTNFTNPNTQQYPNSTNYNSNQSQQQMNTHNPNYPQVNQQQQQQQMQQPQSSQYNPHSNNYPNSYANQQNNMNYQQGGSSNHNNMMQPYSGNQSNYHNQNYPQQNYPNYQNQNYWNSSQHPQQDVKVDPSYYNNCRPYEVNKGYSQNNQWIKQEDVKPIKMETETKPKINIISDISIKNAYDSRGNITPEKKINILSDIKLEPKKEPIDFCDDVKKEVGHDEQIKSETMLEAKIEKIDLDDDSKSSSPVKGLKEDAGIPYDWAVELLQDYVPGFIENSAKMEILFSIVKESLALGDRLLVFSQSLITLDLIEQFLQMNVVPGETQKWAKNTSYYRLDGSTTALEREKLINEFNSNSKVHLFLVSTRAGSLGINLIGANRVVVLDASWNPCHDTQAVCRVYRYGQRKPCFVYRLVVDNCLEKKIYDRQINKQGMSDRVVDECNPDAHLTMKDVTTICWDDGKETEEKDWSYCKDKYIDVVLQKVLQQHGRRFNKEPFQHESLLIDRKDKQLSTLEKRMAKRGYEREKQAARQPNYNAGTGVRHRPVASVRPMQQGGDTRSSRWIPAEHWQRQGMTAQEMTLPLDVVIPTNQPDKGNIVLKAGQKVLVLKSPKGVYMQLESGKIVAIKTAIKVRGKADEDKAKTPPSQPSTSPAPAALPPAIKNNTAISVSTPPKRAVKPFVPTPKINVRGRAPMMGPRSKQKVQMNKDMPVADEHTISSSEDERSEDKRLSYSYRDGQHMAMQPSGTHQDVHFSDGRSRDVRPSSRLSNVQPHYDNTFPKQSGTKATSALQQLEKSTSAIISESKQPFQETLNSITSSYQENDPQEVKPQSQPIPVDDDSEEKPPKHVHQAVKPNIPPSTDYAYSNYYGYNMQPYPAPPTQPYAGYSVQTAPPTYDLSAYPPQPPQQPAHQHPPVVLQQTTTHQQHPPTPQNPSQQVSHSHQQTPHLQPQQTYNYGIYPPHSYPSSAPSQYPTQPYEYSAPGLPPPQPIYATPYAYTQQYPPPTPQPIYSSSNPPVYGNEYQYPPAPPDTAPTYYHPPQT